MIVTCILEFVVLGLGKQEVSRSQDANDYIQKMVAKCAHCQKNRLRMIDYLKPVVCHLKILNLRKRIGIDIFTVTPEDKTGNGHILVVVKAFLKHV